MTQVVRTPDLGRQIDSMQDRIAALERQVAAASVAAFTVTPGYTADRAFNPAATSLTEVATILATLIDDMKT